MSASVLPPSENTALALHADPSTYLIADCDLRTPQVSNALTLALSALPSAIASAQLATQSTHGFTAFFKTQSSAKAVASLFQAIRLLKPLRGRWPNPLRASGPQFICVNPTTVTRYKHLHFDPYLSCQGQGMYGFWARNSRYIFLCDLFFARPVAPTLPSFNTCIRVENNHFQGFGRDMCAYQKYMLVHEMVHFYLGRNGLGLDTKPHEVYGLDQSVGLGEGLSLRNPQNYQAFVAMVDQGCTKAPNPFKPPFGLRIGETSTRNAIIVQNISSDPLLGFQEANLTLSDALHGPR